MNKSMQQYQSPNVSTPSKRTSSITSGSMSSTPIATPTPNSSSATPALSQLLNNTVNNNSYQIQHVQNYIKELELSEGQLSSCVKAVYEIRQKDEFMAKLEEKTKKYDSEIEKLCNENYQDFVTSFYELLSLRDETENLKSELVKNNENLQKIGKNLIGKVDELVKETKKQNNIIMTIDALSRCLPVFDIYRKLKDNMKDKKYYPALKLLEELENNHLPLIKKYRFSLAIQNSIPKFKDEIKNESFIDLKSFLESLRVESELVGKIASSQMAKKNKIDSKYYLLDSETSKVDSSSLATPNGISITEDYAQKFPFDVIDFSPLYRNLHMNQILGTKSSFAEYYRQQRQKQLKLTLQPPMTLDYNEFNTSQTNATGETDSLDGYKRYFHAVTGFFVIEDQIMSSTEGLVDERYFDELAGVAIPKLIEVIRKAMSHSNDADLMLKVKIVVVLFCNTLDEVQFPTTQLSDLLKEIREMYYEMLLNKWDAKIKKILDNDLYNHIEVSDEKAYKRLIQEFPCQIDSIIMNENRGKSEYPKYMAYSESVPKIFTEIKDFVNNCVKFAEGLNSSQTELDDMVRKPTNKLINDKLRESIRLIIFRVTLPQLVQIVINTLYLEKSIDLLEAHLLKVINATSSKQSGKLQGISLFKDLRSEAESRIYELLNDKIDELLDLENFNWTMPDSKGQASDYMKSILSFLKGTLNSFNNLPSKLGQTACISACKHLAQSLMTTMLQSDIKAISFGTFEQISLDLLQCETFATVLSINGLDNETILMCFADIRQLIDLILTKEWSTYIKDHGNPKSKYSRVNPHHALNLLEKLREGSKVGKGLLSNLGFGAKKAEKDDKNLMDLAAKQLRQLISQAN